MRSFIRFVASLVIVLVTTFAAPVTAQDFRGRINGSVTDNTKAVLPGVTVTVSSPALIQAQVQVTGAAGDYRFLALPPGVYDLTFDLAGFQTVKRVTRNRFAPCDPRRVRHQVGRTGKFVVVVTALVD